MATTCASTTSARLPQHRRDFEDFVRYNLTAAENIAVGQIEARGRPRPRIVRPPDAAWPTTSSPSCPTDYDQMVGKRFGTASTCRGGEWQKVAIARAYMRDAQVLILDEPTAALDARSEFEVFQRFKELSDGTDRGADFAPLLQRAHGRPHPGTGRRQGGGAGTHDELVPQCGRYAELFELQAAGTGDLSPEPCRRAFRPDSCWPKASGLKSLPRKHRD